jgi:hypothetical protein
MRLKTKRGMWVAALGAVLLLASSPGMAAPSAMAKACEKDVKSLCSGVKPGGGKLKACVEGHFKELSADCQVEIVRTAAVGKACKADIKQYCAGAKAGKGGVAECVKSHEADLSAGCKEAMAKAQAGDK